jgi:hypothetical protein
VPEDTPFVDEANKAVPFSKATADSFRFGVLGQSRKPANDTEKKLVSIFANKVEKYLELGSVVGTGSHETVTGLVKKKPVIATHTVDLKSTKEVDYKYSVTDFKNSRFIKLDTRKNSLRTSDPEQWKRFMDDLASFNGKNVFILMDKSPKPSRINSNWSCLKRRCQTTGLTRCATCGCFTRETRMKATWRMV